MADLSQKSYLRDRNGPRVVDCGYGRYQHRNGGRRYSDNNELDKPRARHTDRSRVSKRDSAQRQRPSDPDPTMHVVERPTFEMHVVKQPAKAIQLGAAVDTMVLLTAKTTSTNIAAALSNIETSQLFAISSLVTNNPTGERIPLEAGSVTGPKLFDSVHGIPDSYVADMASKHPEQIPIGHFSFPGLVIRQAGIYHIRTTLVKMTDSPGEGGSSLAAVDSDAIMVERRGGYTQRRRQRVYD